MEERYPKSLIIFVRLGSGGLLFLKPKTTCPLANV
ncbi:MAG: hypothetical protein ACI8VT_003386 [Saprospiraceae bacterium]|jgi:hypothetical protein